MARRERLEQRYALHKCRSALVNHPRRRRLILYLSGRILASMKKTISALLMIISLTAPALAATYPVDGRWGQGASPEPGPIDCARLRVIAFNGDQRTDSKGGVPAYRLKAISPQGEGKYRVVDEFTTGQIANAHVTYTLSAIDPDRIEMATQQGVVKLRRCR
jgi:hypothetical protein